MQVLHRTSLSARKRIKYSDKDEGDASVGVLARNSYEVGISRNLV